MDLYLLKGQIRPRFSCKVAATSSAQSVPVVPLTIDRSTLFVRAALKHQFKLLALTKGPSVYVYVITGRKRDRGLNLSDSARGGGTLPRMGECCRNHSMSDVVLGLRSLRARIPILSLTAVLTLAAGYRREYSNLHPALRTCVAQLADAARRSNWSKWTHRLGCRA